MLGESLSYSTRQAYSRVWKSLASFCQTIGEIEGSKPPVAPSVVFLFLTDLISKGMSGSSVCCYSSAISYVHKLCGMRDPTSSFAVTKLIAAAKKLKPTRDLRMPISSMILRKLIDVSHLVIPSHYDVVLIKALFLVCFFGFFRIGELVPKSKARGLQVVQYTDLILVFEHKLASEAHITIRHSKNLEKGGIDRVVLKRHSPLCPVEVLYAFVTLRGSSAGPLFSLPSGIPFLRSRFDSYLQSCVSQAGLKGKYKGHSFRIGAATEAAAKGKSDSHIRNLGRWRSDAFKSYVRLHTTQ